MIENYFMHEPIYIDCVVYKKEQLQNKFSRAKHYVFLATSSAIPFACEENADLLQNKSRGFPPPSSFLRKN